MNPIAHHAESVLHTTPHPALRLCELLDALVERAGRSLTLDRLREALEAHPDRFRILETWQGPWQVNERPGSYAWVVAIESPDVPPDEPPAALRLRESVRWVALGMDPRSRMEVSRWYAIAVAEREARRALVRQAS